MKPKEFHDKLLDLLDKAFNEEALSYSQLLPVEKQLLYINRGESLELEKKWDEAKKPLAILVSSYPDQSGPNNAYAILAAVHRNLN